jgi:hypothetical protein
MARTLKYLLTFRPCPVVKRSATTYMIQRGWALKGGENPHWEGEYHTPDGNFRGWIDSLARPRYCIYQPPEALKREYPSNVIDQHQHGWHTVRFCMVPADLDSGVLEIERLLRHALK